MNKKAYRPPAQADFRQLDLPHKLVMAFHSSGWDVNFKSKLATTETHLLRQPQLRNGLDQVVGLSVSDCLDY